MSWLEALSRYEFMWVALLGALLTSLTCAVLGVYVVQRRMAFIGDALAHTILPGLAIASWRGVNLAVGAIIAAVLTALGIGWVSRRESVKEDTAIGVFFTGMFALGVLIVYATNRKGDLNGMLLGNLLGMTTTDLALIACVFVVVMSALLAFHKELELTSFDRVHAQVIGMQPDAMRYLLLLLLALTVVTCIQAVGVVLTSALLVTPAAAAHLLASRFWHIMLWSAVIAVLSAILGLYLSYRFDSPGGASIVLCCTASFALAWIWRTVSKSQFRGRAD